MVFCIIFFKSVFQVVPTKMTNFPKSKKTYSEFNNTWTFCKVASLVGGLDYGSSDLGSSHGWVFTFTVPLSTQVYKWVPANSMLGVTLRWGVQILLVASCYGNQDKLAPAGWVTQLVCRLSFSILRQFYRARMGNEDKLVSKIMVRY